jgi:hypothetical protein
VRLLKRIEGVKSRPATRDEHEADRRACAMPHQASAAGLWQIEGGSDMSVQEQIDDYLAGQPEPKRNELEELHRLILRTSPQCKTWFLDGRDAQGKIVSNPNIGYGLQTIRYAGGKTREFYQIGLSANTTGISVYIIGIDDKQYLARIYGSRLGKAGVTG